MEIDRVGKIVHKDEKRLAKSRHLGYPSSEYENQYTVENCCIADLPTNDQLLGISQETERGGPLRAREAEKEASRRTELPWDP